MSELDEIVKKQQKGKKKKGGDMKGAVEGAEEIRLWVSKIGRAAERIFSAALRIILFERIFVIWASDAFWSNRSILARFCQISGFQIKFREV